MEHTAPPEIILTPLLAVLPNEPSLPPISAARLAQCACEPSSNPDSKLYSTTDPDKAAPAEPKSETVLYLAYGSNLSSKTFRGTRNIHPLSSINVHVPSLTLTFDLPGVPYLEPCFGNVRWRDSESESSSSSTPSLLDSQELEVESEDKDTQNQKEDKNNNKWTQGLVGVLYELTPSDYAIVIATEGGGSSYQEVRVACYPLARDLPRLPKSPSQPPIWGITLMDKESDSSSPLPSSKAARSPHRTTAQPSPRYASLLQNGSIEHSLPLSYQKHLSLLECYRITHYRQYLGRAFYVVAFAPALLSVMLLGKMLSDKKTGKTPKWLAAIMGVASRVMWGFYEKVGRGIWGEGERTE